MSDVSQLIPFLPPLGCLLAALCLWGALRSARKKRLINDLPTSKTTGVFIGLTELKGTAESERPLASYLAMQGCIYYQWSIQEHWSRTVIETYTDSNGKTQTRTRHESGWTTVAQGGEMEPFYLKDDCGIIRINPEGAKIEPQTIFQHTCCIGDPLYYGKGPAGAVANSDHQRMFTEQAILLHTPLYVVGQARERSDVVAAEIALDKNVPLFLISTRSEEQVSAGFGWSQFGWGLLGLILAPAGFYVLQAQQSAPPNPIPLIAAGGGYILAMVAGWVWMAFNSMIELRQRVRQGWSQVDVQLKRRHDLIPNLVSTIQGLRDYEKNLQPELAQLRTQAEATPPGEPGPDYQACRPVFMAIGESYPELAAQESFLNLQKNLIDTEQRIALARSYFNEIATYYNTRLEVVPDRFVAAIAGMKPQPLMAANEFERAPVEVNLVS